MQGKANRSLFLIISIGVLKITLFNLSKSESWTGEATVMDVPWKTSIDETNIDVIGDVDAISQLNGNYIQNGPALWRYINNNDNISLFFGLPMIRGFYFRNGTISFRARMINDSLYKMMYDMNNINNNNSMNFNISDLMIQSVVTIRKINNNLLANGPSTRSNMIDGITLNTLQSPYVYDDNIGNISHFAPPHSQIDPITKEIFHMFIPTKYEKIPLYYQLYHIKPNTNKRLLASNKIYINEFIDKSGFMQHMNGLTEHFYILCESPPMIQNLTKVIWKIADRYSGKLVATFKSESFVYMHYANSYEFVDEITNQWYIISDVGIMNQSFVSFKNATIIHNMLYDPNNFASISKSMHISRFIFPLNQTAIDIIPKPLLNITGQLMPVIYYEKYNTMPYQYIYAFYCSSIYSPQDSIIKINVPLITTHNELIYFLKEWDAYNLKTPNYKIWHPDAFQNANEPYFIPSNDNSKEDDGYLLNVILNGTTNSSYLLILNATTLSPIATAHPQSQSLNGSLPIAFHARYYVDN